MPHAWEAYGQKKKRTALSIPPSTGKTTATSTVLTALQKITVKYTHTVLLLCICTSGPRQFCNVFFHIHML